MTLTRRDILIGGASAALWPLPLGAATEVMAGPAFGGSWRLVCGGGDAQRLRATINRIIAETDREMSPYLASSALSAFNRATGDDWHPMPERLCTVTRNALRLARFTDGAFDPTVGPAVHRAGFGPITGAAGSYAMIEVGAASLRKSSPHLTLDLCGIAKGHALDRIADALRALSDAPFLIELGGEVRGHGDHPNGRPWQVAIEDPWQAEFAAFRIVAPRGLALATSGHRANGVMGRLATSHIVDPRTQRPSISAIASVSVLDATGERADALATALCAMGEAGPDFARQNGISALFIAGRPDAPHEIPTGSFPDHLVA